MFDSPDELLEQILAGEDSLLDWKEVVYKGDQLRFVPKAAGDADKAFVELAKDLSCFANSDGGVIVFGVRKDGERVGIPPDRMDALVRDIVNAAQNNVEPPCGHLLIFNKVLLPDSHGNRKVCLKLDIKKARFGLHAPRGKRPYRRIADHCYEMSLEEQGRAFERRGMILPFEEWPVLTASREAIDMSLFASYYQIRYGSPLGTAAVDPERLLQNLKLIIPDESGALHPTGLGVLLFSPAPHTWITGAYVDIVVYESADPDANFQRDAKVVRGTLVDQIEQTLHYLQQSPFVPTRARKDGTGRSEFELYSARALQEAVVNALVHRDYSIPGAQMRVFIFPDRIEISNPGRLHNTLTPENLFAGCQPVRRNQMLAGFLRDTVSPLTGRSYMEGRGEGFLAMVRECQRVSGLPPRLEVLGDSVRLTLSAARVQVDDGGSK